MRRPDGPNQNPRSRIDLGMELVLIWRFGNLTLSWTGRWGSPWPGRGRFYKWRRPPHRFYETDLKVWIGPIFVQYSRTHDQAKEWMLRSPVPAQMASIALAVAVMLSNAC